MNLSNREEMLKLSMEVVEDITAALYKRDISIETINIIIDMLKLSITYGFDQGTLHGECIGIRKGSEMAIQKFLEAARMNEKGPMQ